MMYSTHQGTLLDLKIDMYEESELSTTITSMDERKVIPWINGALSITTDFTEAELEGDDSLIRLASCKYNAYSIMSTSLEGHDVDTDSLARVRLEEAMSAIRMWGATHGITPAFDILPIDGGVVGREVVEYAYATGSNEACIG